MSDELHVLLTVEDTENRAQVKLQRAVEEVKKLLVPVSTITSVSCFFFIFQYAMCKVGEGEGEGEKERGNRERDGSERN